MASADQTRQPRLRPKLRDEGESRVTPLELFFDLVFVLAITQCTALMSHDPTWSGIAQGLLVLGVVWWAWVGYAWLTSVVDPEEGAVRLVIFGAMAALLIVSLCVPHAFGNLALVFALAYGLVRVAQIGLFILASPDDDALRHSVLGLAVSTGIAVSLLIIASLFDGLAQGALWALVLFLDLGGAYLIPPAGWKLVPEHFAERHGLIVIIALGESIVAIGVGASGELSFGIGTAAVLGVTLAAAMWWVYFDIVALVSGRRLAAAEPGREQNAMARDSYSYLHLPMVAGIVLVALGLKKTIGHFDGHPDTVLAFALLGGVAIYLLSLVAFRYRHVSTWNTRRLGLAVILLILVPVAVEIPAIATLALVNVLLWGLIAIETREYGDTRQSVRHPGEGEPGTGPDWPRG
jgi:low temperature requirement protein LtrA